MIRNVSEILKGIMHEEQTRLDAYTLKHGPTIGSMYEGLTSDILGRAIPESLGLQIQHGIIHDGADGMSGEIDCMLVKGSGEKIPFTNSYKWHIKDVIAVIEVKKTLYSKDLKDSFCHLRGVMDNFDSYVQKGNGTEIFDINPARKAFSEATGLIPPPHKDVSTLGIEKEVIYHTFVMEQLSPIRIVLGYHGFKKEESLRKALVDFIEKNTMSHGFGVRSFPQLIACNSHSLIKMNGYPYSAPMDSEFWNFYASSNTNPILLILELIWTRISHEHKIGNLWGEDLEVEMCSLFLSGKITQKNEKIGWEYKYTPISETNLKNKSAVGEWMPFFVTSTQYTIFNCLCSSDPVYVNDKDFKEFIGNEGGSIDEFVQSLIKTGLVARNGDKLELTSYQCQCVILPDGRFCVAENNSGRLSRWVKKQIANSKA